jgi:hypothetical protein
VKGKQRQVPLENRKCGFTTSLLRKCGWLERIAGLNVASPGKRDGGMENFLLFILSSSVCTLVASVTLLLRPLVGMP